MPATFQCRICLWNYCVRIYRSIIVPAKPHGDIHTDLWACDGYHFIVTIFYLQCLTLIPLTWRIWWANKASRWQMGFNLVFKGLILYTGCNRRNGPDFGRVFLMLMYTEKPQNTYIQSWTVWEIIASKVWNFDSCYTLTDYQIRIETGRNMWFL